MAAYPVPRCRLGVIILLSTRGWAGTISQPVAVLTRTRRRQCRGFCIRLGRLIDEGTMTETMAALAKYFSSVKARHVCRLARDVPGGNGITLDFHVVRHLCDMEALVTTRARPRSRPSSSDGV